MSWWSSSDQDLSEYGVAGFQVSRSSFKGSVTVSGRLAGISFKHYTVPSTRNRRAHVVVLISTNAPGALLVEEESASDKFAKGLGLVNQFRTGDAELDEKYYFAGTTDEYVSEVFSNSGNLDATRRILAGRCTRFEKRDNELRASAYGKDLLPVAELKDVVAQLARLRLPSAVHGAEREAISGRNAAWLVLSVAVLIGAPGWWGLLYTKPLLDGGWTFASHEARLLGALTIAFLVFAYFVLKGHSMQARLFLGLLMFTPLLAAAFAGLLMILNERFDRSEITAHEAQLVQRYETHSRRSTHYHLVFRSWRGRGSENISVNYDTYLLAATRPPLWELRTREGRLGEPWVESMAVPTHAVDVRSTQ